MPNILEAFLSKPLVRKEFSVAELSDKWSRLKAIFWECSDSVVDDDQQVFDGISRILEDSCKCGIPVAEQCGNGYAWSKAMNYELVVEQLAYVENKSQQYAIINFLNSMLSVSQQRKLSTDLRDKRDSINDKKTRTQMIIKNCKIGKVVELNGNMTVNNGCKILEMKSNLPVRQTTDEDDAVAENDEELRQDVTTSVPERTQGIVVTDIQ